MKNFKLDTNNIGGMKMLNDNMYKHHKALIQVKPAINIKPPRPHVNQIQKQNQKQPKLVDLPMYKNKDDYDQVFKTFQTVMQMNKGRIDNNTPQTFEMKKNISGKQTKKEQFENEQHQLNLRSQYRRIFSAGRMQERMKNPNDPIAHPPKFFRREGETMANIKIDSLLQHFTKEQRLLEEQQNDELLQRVNKIEERKLKSAQPQSKNNNATVQHQQRKNTQLSSSRKNGRNKDEITTFVQNIPKMKGTKEEDFEWLRQALIRIIFHHKIYKHEDLESLFQRVLVENPQIEIVRGEILFEEIRNQLSQ